MVSDPYSREHQEKILRFRQEIDCTSKVLQDQSYCVDQVLDRVGKGATHAPWPFQRERESYILQDCLSAIEAKTRRFADMSEDAAQLSSWVSTVSATLCYAIVQAKADVGQNVGLRPEVVCSPTLIIWTNRYFLRTSVALSLTRIATKPLFLFSRR